MILSQLHKAADTRDIDNTRCVAFFVCASFGEKAKESCRDEEYGERIRAVQIRPLFEGLMIKEGHS